MAVPLEKGVYLASRSPRRRELLSQIGVRYQLLLFRARPGEAADVDEAPLAGEAPDAYVVRLARAKAEAGWRRMLQRNLPPGPVLAADTTVALEGRIFAKPAGREDAAAMLRALSGRTHEVLTAVAIKHDDWLESVLSRSEVRFKDLSEAELAAYVANGEGDDKAGAYAIQGGAAKWIYRIEGDYFNVVGLPLAAVWQMLQRTLQ